MGSPISLVDMAIFPFIRQYSNVDKHWFIENYPFLATWLKNIVDLQLFSSVMERYSENDGEPFIVNFNANN